MNGHNYKKFGRTADLLFALADLAERAGRACPPVRFFVLFILRWAVAVAFAYAEEAAGAPLPPAFYLWTDDVSNDDEASRLAQSFRALAAVFRILAHRARLAQQKPPATPCGLFSRRPAVDFSRTIFAFLARPLDTS